MSITEKEGKTVITMSFLWRCGAMLLLGLVMAQTSLLFTWGIWITAEVQKTKTDVAVMQSGIQNIQSRISGISSQVGKLPGKVATALSPQSNNESN